MICFLYNIWLLILLAICVASESLNSCNTDPQIAVFKRYKPIILTNTHQHAVAVVQPEMHQGNYQLMECGGRYMSADLTQLTKNGKATRHPFS